MAASGGPGDGAARRTFLTGSWRYLAMLNYVVPPESLAPYVPRGTALDTLRGEAYVSVVGFLFRDTRLLGVPVPLHRDFEEVNLRFYVVRREADGSVRRGVTFVRELVPRPAIALVARLAYNEPYTAMAMRHRIEHVPGSDEAPRVVEYSWRQRSGWSRLGVEPTGLAAPVAEGSDEEFITEHYWGYTRQRDGSTVEYRVAHPRWRVWPVARAALEADAAELYGPAFAGALAAPPRSAFLAEGSAISVSTPRRLPRQVA